MEFKKRPKSSADKAFDIPGISSEDRCELICRWSPDGRILSVNEAYCRYFRKTRKELTESSFFSFILKNDLPGTRKHLSSLTRKKPVGTHENRVMKTDGKIRWQQWTNRKIFDKKGELLEIQSAGRDITEIKETGEELKKKTERLQALYETGKKINSIASKEELLHWIAEEACKLLGADACLYRIRKGEYLIPGGSTKSGTELMKKEELKIGESLNGIIAKKKKPLIIEDVRDDKRYIREHREIAKRLGYISFLGVPMMIDNKVIGVINVRSKKPGKFHEKDRELLSAFADQAAVALENARLFRELKQEIAERRKAEKRIKEKAKKLHSLYEGGKKITSMISKEELLPWIAKQACRLLDADLCNYRIREGEYLVRGGGSGGGMEIMKTERIKIGESLSGMIAKTKKPLIIKTIAGDKRHLKEHNTIAEKFGFTSFLGVPMMMGNEVMGVINVITKKSRAFTRADTDLLSSFADQAAIALSKAHLFEDVKEARNELEKWGKDLEKKVKQRTRELKKMHGRLLHSERLAATGRLGASIAHEINNPLQAIDSFISLVLNKTMKNSKNREYLTLAREGINRIAKIVKQLLAFHHPETSHIELSDPNAVVEDALSLVQNHLFLQNIQLKKELSPDLPKARLSPLQIQQVLLNLILNAKDSMPQGGELKVKTFRSNGCINIDISDSGIGISGEALKKIFEPFFTTKKEMGRGLGLFVSYGIIKAHGGDIEVKSTKGKGTSFTIKIPLK